ncbi:multicopper oxidase family protein [Ramlibacter sp. Leaf400]|uniref:multicopper oxidase family protein n=1 Tax=Ramlibacter sp. Leaf400 TaxID=1736365 RepID=UPI0006F3B588|nr:multicopper oxidase domain-containing protein [Ramlibacter sp. Leaf400]KQT11380.1 hypothetical protein ASG30_05770 [Ramlibacter sp. Leaf400]
MQVRPSSSTALPASRRTALKTAGAAAAAILAPQVARSQLVIAPGRVPSPTTSLWAEPLPVPKPAWPMAALDPVPSRTPFAGEARRADHQGWSDVAPDLYELKAEPIWHEFHPDLPRQEVWGFNGQTPGPLIHARYGKPVIVRYRNNLPRHARGPGSPEISIHLHNFHSPSESDGHPDDYFPSHSLPGAWKDSCYPMRYAGDDPCEALGTMWYHDHRHHYTASNVYKGLAGFFLAFDELDSGNENDGNPKALRLPSGEFDVPLMVQDKQFDSSGYVSFDALDPDGFVGDKFLVNGKIQPFFHVRPRKYRLRLLDGSTARVLDLQIRHQNQAQKFTYIANDGNLLEAPLEMSSVHLAPAERADLVVDFSKYPVGAELFLVNRLQMLDGRKPEKDFLRTPIPLLKFIVDQPSVPDYSRVPTWLRKLPEVDIDYARSVAVRREARLGRSNGGWTINDRIYSSKPAFKPRQGQWELWTVRNDSGGWVHPVHIHLEEGRLLSRNGRPPPPHERGRKNVFYANPNERLEILIRFRDFKGKYVTHCHNTLHEDHGMMENFEVVAS